MLAGILDNAVPNGNIGIELNAFLYEKIYFVLFLLVLLKISENVFHVSRFRGTFAMLQILFSRHNSYSFHSGAAEMELIKNRIDEIEIKLSELKICNSYISFRIF